MKNSILCFAWLCAMVVALPSTTFAQAPFRTWVSADGSDGNTCLEAAPCLTFAHAFTVTSAGGEIDCLTGGDFGPVHITHPITIDCGEGLVGGIGTPSGGAAINIDLTSAGIVILRNLTLNGFNSSSGYGIITNGFPGGLLIIQHCSIHGFTNGFGIDFSPTSGRGSLEVSDTAVYNNSSGIAITPASGVIASVTFDRDHVNNNNNAGLILGTGIIAGTLRQSVVAQNGSDGVDAAGSVGGQIYFTVEETSIIDNLGNGIVTHAPGVIVNVGASTIGGNGTGVSAAQGSIISFGNNQMSANGANGTFTSTAPLQ